MSDNSHTAFDAATLAGATIVLVASSVHAREHRISPTESDIFAKLNGLPEQCTPILYVLMQAGQFGAVPMSAAIARVAKRPRLGWALLASGTAAWLLAKLVKRFTQRGRPAAHLDAVVIRGKEWTGLGFPSGHVAVAAGLATVATPALARPLRPLVWALVGFVAVSRIHVGAHLPVDTVGGIAMGVLTGRAAIIALDP